MRWKSETRGGWKVRGLRRSGNNVDYPWEGQWLSVDEDDWVNDTWTDEGLNRLGSCSVWDLVPADPTDCTICEQDEPVDADGLCPHCVERLNKLGYFKNAQAIGMAEQLGTLKGLIEHLAEKCK